MTEPEIPHAGGQAGRARPAQKQGMHPAVDRPRHCLDWTLANITAFYHPDGLP